MEEINLKELFDYIKERIFMILAITLAVIALGCVYSSFLKTPMYRSTSSVLLVSDDGQASGGATGTTQSDVQLNKSLVSTYSELVKSKTVLKTVIKNLELDYELTELDKKVTVSNVNNTEIIKIEVVDSERERAAEIANEVVKTFGDEIKKHYKLQNVSVVDVAEVAEKPYNINFLKELIIYLLLGAVLSVGIVFVIFYFDTTIKSAEEVENKLGLPVLGIVPKTKSK
jgi:capsular polysaccharide biosynthesis protein